MSSGRAFQGQGQAAEAGPWLIDELGNFKGYRVRPSLRVF